MLSLRSKRPHVKLPGPIIVRPKAHRQKSYQIDFERQLHKHLVFARPIKTIENVLEKDFHFYNVGIKCDLFDSDKKGIRKKYSEIRF